MRGKLAQQAATKAVAHGFGPVVNAQLCVDVLDMIARGDWTDMERLCQRFGFEASGEHVQNLSFAARERLPNFVGHDICSFYVFCRTGGISKRAKGPEHENRGNILEQPGNGHGPYIDPDRFSPVPRDRQIEVLDRLTLHQRFSNGAIRIAEFISIQGAAANHFMAFSPRRRRTSMRENFCEYSILVNDALRPVRGEDRIRGSGEDIVQCSHGSDST
jgi:hypothetical protein